MVHYRLNANEPIPNPHVNFITALPMPQQADQEHARQLLRALAAQIKPVMKTHGFVVNSLEEYEYNRVFAGRNWNAGEVVELVLRRENGVFVSTSWLMSTLCHELAHIKHMNHGPAFQALWSRLSKEVRELQERGYYGDGYWSAGTRLADSARVAGDGGEVEELPEFMSYATHISPARRRQPTAGPSNRTGAQTTKKRKAGSRVTAASAFKGDGRALNAHIEDEDDRKVGAGFRKKATRTSSKRAREERAFAAERRMRALQGKGKLQSSPLPKTELADSDDDESDGIEVIRETDQDRRRTMLESMEPSDMDGLKSGTLTDYWRDFILPKSSSSSASASRAESGSKGKQNVVSTASHSANGTRQSPLDELFVARGHSSASSTERGSGVGKRIGNLVMEEVNYRKQEALGLAPIRVARTLGTAPHGSVPRDPMGFGSEKTHSHVPNELLLTEPSSSQHWACLVCTLCPSDNEAEYLACSACGTPRGETAWEGNYA
ncbi:hypothetical protein EW146_g661 [Bondarzewia mesenterica]|uniref:WLM domain-containing protein n=1 Tax=Bondarzewia mesenterica TaxID=1095465 RepID=A0A4S4M691_9AGAM|nr:hypothetical protein EW146_g661 [Bondarzewia mesenterica]